MNKDDKITEYIFSCVWAIIKAVLDNKRHATSSVPQGLCSPTGVECVYSYLSIERKQILIKPVSVGTMDGLFILQQRPHYMNRVMRKHLALANSNNTFQVALHSF